MELPGHRREHAGVGGLGRGRCGPAEDVTRPQTTAKVGAMRMTGTPGKVRDVGMLRAGPRLGSRGGPVNARAPSAPQPVTSTAAPRSRPSRRRAVLAVVRARSSLLVSTP